MNITQEQRRNIKCLLTKEDKEEIASLTGLSYKSIKAVLLGDRNNDIAENYILKKVKQRHKELTLILEEINKQNK